MEWQCVELANRLYITKGWVSSTWYGNQLYSTAPSVGLTNEQKQGSITYLAPGDVISFNGPDSGGHAAVVSQASGSKITLVNQNTSQASVLSTGTLSGGSLIMNGWAGYTPIGVVHALVSQPPPPPAASTANLLLNGGFWNNQTAGWHWLASGSSDTGSFTAYSSASVPEGGNFLEFNTSEPGGSVYQDVAASLRPGQSYTFSVWVRANASVPVHVCVALFGIGANTQSGHTCRTVRRAWTLISAPYDVGPSGESTLRAQVYLDTAGVNCDLNGASFTADRPTVPASPSRVTARAETRKAIVRWRGPAWNGGIAITGYRITVRPGGRKITVRASARRAVIRRLKRHRRYTFTVTAFNGVGAGNPSGPSRRIVMP